MKKLIVCLSLLAMFVASQAFAATIIVDDFSGDLSAYTQSVVNTRTGCPFTEAEALGKAVYSISNGELTFSTPGTGSSTTKDDVAQSTFLRDDYSLKIGDRVQVDLDYRMTSDADSTAFGLCIASTKSFAFSSGGLEARKNLAIISVTDYTGTTQDKIQAVRFNNDASNNYLFSNAERDVDLNSIIGLYIERDAANEYTMGYMTSTGDVDHWTFTDYTGGANAIGFFADPRSAAAPFMAADNLTLITPAEVPEPSTAMLIFVGLAMLAVRKRFA